MFRFMRPVTRLEEPDHHAFITTRTKLLVQAVIVVYIILCALWLVAAVR